MHIRVQVRDIKFLKIKIYYGVVEVIMALIEVENINKEFKVYKRQKGFVNNMKSLVVRKYEIKKAVSDISFSINQGELVGYIGSNGAGKSTTIKMLSGILVPTSGNIKIDGQIPYKNRQENAKKIGVVFGQRSQLNWDLPMEDTFELYQRMYKIDNKVYKDNLEMCTQLMQMQDFIRKPVRQLSLGQKMRAEIAIALLHSPKILYLDEPTIGLDVLVKDRIRKFIRELNSEKKTTVILTTHDMTDIDQICDRIIMIDQGKLLSDTTLQNFKDMHADHYYVEVFFDEIYEELNAPGLALIKKREAMHLYIIKKSEMPVNEVLERLARAYKIKDISIRQNGIEDIVKKVYEKMV